MSEESREETKAKLFHAAIFAHCPKGDAMSEESREETKAELFHAAIFMSCELADGDISSDAAHKVLGAITMAFEDIRDLEKELKKKEDHSDQLGRVTDLYHEIKRKAIWLEAQLVDLTERAERAYAESGG